MPIDLRSEGTSIQRVNLLKSGAENSKEAKARLLLKRRISAKYWRDKVVALEMNPKKMI